MQITRGLAAVAVVAVAVMTFAVASTCAAQDGRAASSASSFRRPRAAPPMPRHDWSPSHFQTVSGNPSSLRTSPATAHALGAAFVAQAEPDGLHPAVVEFGLEPHRSADRQECRYDPVADFSHIVMLTSSPMCSRSIRASA